jgi:hypothetical protein
MRIDFVGYWGGDLDKIQHYPVIAIEVDVNPAGRAEITGYLIAFEDEASEIEVFEKDQREQGIENEFIKKWGLDVETIKNE